jgi:hypothetical protein
MTASQEVDVLFKDICRHHKAKAERIEDYHPHRLFKSAFLNMSQAPHSVAPHSVTKTMAARSARF